MLESWTVTLIVYKYTKNIQKDFGFVMRNHICEAPPQKQWLLLQDLLRKGLPDVPNIDSGEMELRL